MPPHPPRGPGRASPGRSADQAIHSAWSCRNAALPGPLPEFQAGSISTLQALQPGARGQVGGRVPVVANPAVHLQSVVEMRRGVIPSSLCDLDHAELERAELRDQRSPRRSSEGEQRVARDASAEGKSPVWSSTCLRASSASSSSSAIDHPERSPVRARHVPTLGRLADGSSTRSIAVRGNAPTPSDLLEHLREIERFVEQGGCRPVIHSSREDGPELLEGRSAPGAGRVVRAASSARSASSRAPAASPRCSRSVARRREAQAHQHRTRRARRDAPRVHMPQRLDESGHGFRRIGRRQVVSDRLLRLSGSFPVVRERRRSVRVLSRRRLERLRRASMQLLPAVAQERGVRNLLHESMREGTSRALRYRSDPRARAPRGMRRVVA